MVGSEYPATVSRNDNHGITQGISQDPEEIPVWVWFEEAGKPIYS